jgi:hypothetical protein
MPRSQGQAAYPAPECLSQGCCSTFLPRWACIWGKKKHGEVLLDGWAQNGKSKRARQTRGTPCTEAKALSGIQAPGRDWGSGSKRRSQGLLMRDRDGLALFFFSCGLTMTPWDGRSFASHSCSPKALAVRPASTYESKSGSRSLTLRAW